MTNEALFFTAITALVGIGAYWAPHLQPPTVPSVVTWWPTGVSPQPRPTSTGMLQFASRWWPTPNSGHDLNRSRGCGWYPCGQGPWPAAVFALRNCHWTFPFLARVATRRSGEPR